MPGPGELILHSGRLTDPGRHAASHLLIRDVLGATAMGHDAAAGPWHAFAYFTPDGRCVAYVDAAVLTLVLEGETRDAGAIRSVAVDPAWRGRGLFRALMTKALAWCEAKPTAVVFLYTEDENLYRRFGFEPLPQHAFVGAAPASRRGARRLQVVPNDPDAVVREAIARRGPVSRQCALLVDTSLFLANVAADDSLEIAYDADSGAAIVYEIEGDLLTVADIAAPVVPDMKMIVGVLGVNPRRIKTLFPPDLLGWHGEPVAEDTGLMARGTVPRAMMRPFMFPPTAEF